MPSLTEWKVPPANQPRAERLRFRSRPRAGLGGRPAFDHPGRRLQRRHARHRARRQWRADRRRPGADHRLSDHRGRNGLAASRRRPRGARATRSASISKPASAWCRRSAASTSSRCRSVPPAPRRSATASWSAAPADARARSPSHIAAKQEFAGYWEYLLDEAIFTYPAHPNWGGTGLISNRGELIGIGSLQLERERDGKAEHVNMIVPIDLLKPVLDDLRKFGRVNKPARPWLGMYLAPRSRTGSWWSASPARGRPRAPNSRPAT